jgi:hypothetical protein
MDIHIAVYVDVYVSIDVHISIDVRVVIAVYIGRAVLQIDRLSAAAPSDLSRSAQGNQANA